MDESKNQATSGGGAYLRVVEYGVEVLHPDGVDRSVEDDPGPVGDGVVGGVEVRRAVLRRLYADLAGRVVLRRRRARRRHAAVKARHLVV